jgi:hypothetical protein
MRVLAEKADGLMALHLPQQAGMVAAIQAAASGQAYAATQPAKEDELVATVGKNGKKEAKKQFQK